MSIRRSVASLPQPAAPGGPREFGVILTDRNVGDITLDGPDAHINTLFNWPTEVTNADDVSFNAGVGPGGTGPSPPSWAAINDGNYADDPPSRFRGRMLSLSTPAAYQFTLELPTAWKNESRAYEIWACAGTFYSDDQPDATFRVYVDGGGSPVYTRTFLEQCAHYENRALNLTTGNAIIGYAAWYAAEATDSVNIGAVNDRVTVEVDNTGAASNSYVVLASIRLRGV